MSLYTHATGIPCIWIGVGLMIRLDFKNFTKHSGSFISANVTAGGGTSSPSTIMWYFSRSFWFCSSLRSLMYLGGLQLHWGCYWDENHDINPEDLRCFERFGVNNTLGKLHIRCQLLPTGNGGEDHCISFFRTLLLSLLCICTVVSDIVSS